jgi:hypothetical protein
LNDKIHKCAVLADRILAFIAIVVFLFLILLAVTGPPSGIVDWLEIPELAPRETPRWEAAASRAVPVCCGRIMRRSMGRT